MASINYPSEDLKEPFGCVPTSSLIVQVNSRGEDRLCCTGRCNSTLFNMTHVLLLYLQEMMCNAILTELIQRKGIDQETFKLNHPGGAIGLKLNSVV